MAPIHRKVLGTSFSVEGTNIEAPQGMAYGEGLSTDPTLSQFDSIGLSSVLSAALSESDETAITALYITIPYAHCWLIAPAGEKL